MTTGTTLHAVTALFKGRTAFADKDLQPLVRRDRIPFLSYPIVPFTAGGCPAIVVEILWRPALSFRVLGLHLPVTANTWRGLTHRQSPNEARNLSRKTKMANLIPMSPARVVVLAADNTPMNTQLLVGALSQDKQFQMVESPSSPAATLGLVKRDKPDVVVLSGDLTESAAGADLIPEIRLVSPWSRVVVLLNSSEREAVISAFRAGAVGVFCRTEPVRVLAKCIRCVHAGQVWASSAELQFVVQALGRPGRVRLTPETEAALSAREIDVVVGLTDGLSNREIARRLNLTEHTVKNYLCRIFEKLGVSSRVEVILQALGRTSSSELAAPSGPLKRPHLVPESSRGRSKGRSSMREIAN
jgi:DNA-binding NarL/FixJ family response regulator